MHICKFLVLSRYPHSPRVQGLPSIWLNRRITRSRSYCLSRQPPPPRFTPHLAQLSRWFATAPIACLASLLRLASSTTGGASATEPWSVQGGYGGAGVSELIASSGRKWRSERINRNERCERQRCSATIEVADREGGKSKSPLRPLRKRPRLESFTHLT